MIASTPYHSAEGALTPTLATSPSELTAANAVASGVDSLAFFVGPALAGLLLGVVSTAAVFGLMAVFLAVSVVFIALIKPESEASEHPQGELASSTIVTEALAGFRAIATDSSLRVMMGLLTAQTFITGAMAVYIVVTAIQLVDLGASGVGYLSSALGVGAFIGAVGALSLTGARRLGPPFLLGVVFWGLPLIIVGLWPSAAIALIMFGMIGVSNSVADVAGYTIIQRAVPDEVLARVFGVVQMLLYSAMGIGAVLAPALISWLGIQNALIATGAVLPVLVALSWTRVAGIDAAAKAPEPDELRLLGRTPIFAPLAGTSLEQVATRLVPHRFEPGTVIIREGDKGDRFYLVAEGKVQVSQDGQPISELEAGGYFGEIALLRDMPRTATVTSLTPVVLYSLDRPDFLAAVTGHAASADAADTVVSARLAGAASTGRRSSAA
jgi:Cyclic nucleotide-binding domain/Major Facilitator Superfamily